MKYERNANKRKVLPAILFGLNSVGLLYPAMVTPVRYPDKNAHDMQRIGQDMRLAIESYTNAKKENVAYTSAQD